MDPFFIPRLPRDSVDSEVSYLGRRDSPEKLRFPSGDSDESSDDDVLKNGK